MKKSNEFTAFVFKTTMKVCDPAAINIFVSADYVLFYTWLFYIIPTNHIY